MEVKITDYGIKNNGKALLSKSVQKVIDEVASNGGGTIVFPKGTYILSTVFLRDNIHIKLDEATILGSIDFYDYEPDENVDYPLYQDQSHSFFNCSMFVGRNCKNISITGKGKIDMRSVWDENNVRGIVHRGPKCIALKDCENVEISGIEIYNVTDLAVYFAGCKNVDVFGLKMRVYIDGVSPDNSQNVRIHDCEIESGDDGIVFKTSYTLNRYEECRDIKVYNCIIRSRCNAFKFGTESNCAFKNIEIYDCEVFNTRITGISIESVDGAVIDGITMRNIKMTNAATPLFIHLGKRMRAPKEMTIGSISNITLENITATGKYEPYPCVAWNYRTYIANDVIQDPKAFGRAEGVKYEDEEEDWQTTSNVCGLPGNMLKNITLKNITFELDGGIKEYKTEVPEEPITNYPEVYVYGRFLPAKGIYFRHVDGLTIENVKIKTYRPDVREDFYFEDVKNLIIK